MNTSETQNFQWLPAFDPEMPTVAAMPAVNLANNPTVVSMPAIDPAESRTVVVEAVTPSPTVARVAGEFSLLDQANLGVHVCLDKAIDDANQTLRTGLGRESQLTYEDWGLVVGFLRDRDQRELDEERALALATATVNGRQSATGAYITGGVTLAQIFRSPVSEPGKIEVPAVNTEDLQSFTRLALHEGFAELSADPIHGGQGLMDALQVLQDAVRTVPDFDADKAGFQALLGRTLYYKAAFPNEKGYEDATAKLIRKCYFVVREVLTLHALEQMRAGATYNDIRTSVLTNKQ